MKVLFIYPDLLPHRPDWPGYFYAGIGSLSAVLKQHDHRTSLFHITGRIEKATFMRRVESEAPDLIAFSTTSPMFPLVREYASWLDEAELRLPTVCGGLHPTIVPEEVIATPGIDVLCRGEGEFALLEICDRLEKGEEISGIENLWTRRDGEVVRNPLRRLIHDLGILPHPDRSIFDYPNLFHEREGVGVFMTSRGCPYDCSYCCNHLLRKINGKHSKAVRFRSVDNVLHEVRQVLAEYPFIEKLNFDDDILFMRKPWAEEFAEKYGSEIHYPFVCNARANITSEETVRLLKKAGCIHVKFGLESGNEYIANEVLTRQLTNDSLKRAFALCREAGLITESFNMVGIPHETPSAVLDTIKINAEMRVDKMQVSIYQPYRGTSLEQHCVEQKFSDSRDLDADWYEPIMDLRTISSSHVAMFRDHFKVLVQYYRVLMMLPAGISSVLIKLSDAILSSPITARALNLSYVPLNYLYRRFFTLRLKARIALGKRWKRCFGGIRPVALRRPGER